MKEKTTEEDLQRGLKELRDNLKKVEDLQARLSFILKEVAYVLKIPQDKLVDK